ncbi:MAG: hypothetical protein RSC93_01040 [Erysipelotrichaceae bacterium]
MKNFRTFNSTVFNIDDISIVKAVEGVEEWGEDIEYVKYMLIVLKSGIQLRTYEKTFHKFNGNSKDYLKYILNSSINIDVS